MRARPRSWANAASGVTYLGRERPARGSLGLRAVRSDAHEVPYDRYGVGLHHLAFVAPSRAVVDACAAWLRESGAEIESGPGEFPYSPGYYAVFCPDPDGIKIEVVHTPNRQVEA